MEKQKIIENFKKQIIIANYSDQTIKNYLSVLKLFLEWVEKRNISLNKVTNEEIQDYLFYCKNDKKYSFSTMTQVIKTISFLFGKVLDKPIPKALDFKLKKPTNIPTVLSAKDISKILAVTKNLKHKTVLLLMYSAGLRLGELLNLKIGDIDSESMKIHVRRAKGKKDRYIMLSENVLKLLGEYYKIYKPKEYIIEGIKGGKYSPQSVQSLFKTALKKAGIKKKATVHSLRHSFATHLMDEGTDIRYIQELLGHKRLETTQIYTHISSFTIDKIKSPADILKLSKGNNYMRNYSYKCFNCQTEYSADKVESEFIYLCPKCGTAEKNKPLRGVLTVEYNYEKIKDEYSKEDLLKHKPGKFWQYPFLFPVDFSKFSHSVLLRLSLPEVQLFEYEINGRKVLVQDETRNPTLSYKDRATSLVALKAKELGITEIAAASTGNAGSSLAGICARLGLKSIVYVPKNIPDAKRIQISAYGAKLEVVNGDYDLAFDKCLEDSAINKWYNRNTAYNPLTIEGKKSAAFDIFISTKGNLPDYIFVPVGDGVIISGIYKGFKELFELGWIEKLPKLIAVQSVKSDAVVRYLNSIKFEYKSADTVADSISAGAPRNLYMAADSVKKSSGFGIAVTDKEILQAQKEFIKKTGILCEPSSAAVFAAYQNIIKENRIDCNEKILLLITGNGLKDIASLQK